MAYKRLIEKYKSIRKQSYLKTLGNYRFKYAFAGVGHHSISNLYPCLESLRVPLSLIYSRAIFQMHKHSLNTSRDAPLPKTYKTCYRNPILREFSYALTLLNITCWQSRQWRPGNMCLLKNHLVKHLLNSKI